jgi:polyhydroxyalkanoate synthesis regulator phasin
MLRSAAEFRRAKIAAQEVEDQIVAAYRSGPMSREESRQLVEDYKENAVLQQRTFRRDYNEARD